MTGQKRKKITRTKHVPQRTCVGCQEVTLKRRLVRLVRSETGIVIDPTGRLAGRGVYLHDSRTCWENGLKGAISRGLKTELTEIDIEHIKSYLEKLS